MLVSHPKPVSKDEMWQAFFGHVKESICRWHHYSSRELNLWFNQKRSSTLRAIQNKFQPELAIRTAQVSF